MARNLHPGMMVGGRSITGVKTPGNDLVDAMLAEHAVLME
jgi:hypothetical protein